MEINDKHFGDTAIARLKHTFQRATGVDADDALVVEPAFWAPVIQPYEDNLFRRVLGSPDGGYFRWLNSQGTRADRGSATAVLLAAASGLLRWVPGAAKLDFPTLRWLTVQYIGDAIAYQITSGDRTIYDQVHLVLARTLRELARRAGADAPLCVLAHSLGSVIATNYLYDLQVEAGRKDGRKDVRRISDRVRKTSQKTPLERGETLSFLYTLGSPIALWALRYRNFGRPVHVPPPQLADHHPELRGRSEWINFYHKDDLVSSPLKPLNDEYAEHVSEDREVSVGPPWLSWTPLSHPWYWNDRRVIDPVGKTLANAWRTLNHH
ncbi:hypothetical protein [Gandjariella thermophila]|uniref:hypothetical protein n=1 Tax=Gandjariella thermophila TaxID=1931992 RepID=UPI0010F75C3C|nr:hypothetical protein [Gandjariella thermophila]